MNLVESPSKTADDPLPDLIRTLRGKSAVDRVRAAKDLGRLGWLARDAMPALVAALDDDDAKVRESAAQAVGLMGPEALPSLVRMLTHDDKYVRRHAVWAMGKLGPLARPAIRDLCAVLKDPDPRTASGAAQALGNMGTDGADAVPLLAEAMRGTNIVLCRLAAKALSQIGPPALSTLIAHLQHTDPFVRGESALALGWMGPPARTAVPFLATVVRGPRGFDERSAKAKKASDSVLSGTATPASVPPPDEAGSTEDTARVYAAQALGRIGQPAARALPDLQNAVRFGSSALRSAAEQAVRMIQGSE